MRNTQPAARLLIVEDQNIIAWDLKTRLENLGYQVTAIAASGEQALQQVQDTSPDLVLMDIILKGALDGIESAARIRANFEVPIVYVTAHSDEVTLQRASATEPHGYILKPFDDSDLRAAIELALVRHNLERQLRENEARFRALIEHATDIIVVLDARSRVIYTSPSARRLFGDSPLDRLDDLLAVYVNPEDAARLGAILSTIQQQPGAQISLGECLVRLADGGWHTLAGTVTNLLDNPAVQGLVVNAYDVTPQTRAAEAAERLFVAEQRHARELGLLNNAMHMMTSSLDLQQVLTAIISELKHVIDSEGLSVLLRDGDSLTFAAASGPGAGILLGTHIPLSAGVAGAVLQSRTPTLIENVQRDERFYDGVDRQSGFSTRSLLAVPLIAGDQVIGVMEAVNKVDGSFDPHDLELAQAIAASAVIAIKNARMYEALQEHNRLLQISQPRRIQTEKMAALGRLTTSLAHEINNPLQVVQGCHTLISETLEDPDQTDAQKLAAVRQDLTMAMGEVERMAALIRRLRDFYQPLHAPTGTTDLRAVIDAVLSLTRQQITGHQIVLEQQTGWREDEPWPQVAAKSDHLKHVLLNLILAALENMPSGGQLGLHFARTEFRRPNSEQVEPAVRIDIHDTGPAIPEELLPYVFEPFHAVRASDSGLSLSICYELVTSIGGEIAVVSQPEAGTTFTVWLPTHVVQLIT
jgi:PAS domain S-box-containing protein